MPYLNRFAFVGNLTKAPELRLQVSPGKQALCILNVAINRDSRDESGEKKTKTTFVNDIEVWGASGESCARLLTCGSLVLVEARMEVDQWTDKKSGSKRSRIKFVAENVQFLRIRRAEGESPTESATLSDPSLETPRPRTRRAAVPAAKIGA